MKFYTPTSVLNFGKFQGKTTLEVAGIQPSYIDWCAINVDHFFINEEAIEELNEKHPVFTLSEEAKEKLEKKYVAWENEQEDYQYYDGPDDYDYPDNQDYEQDTFDALTDGQYGSYHDWRGGGGDLDGLMDGMGY